MPDFIDHNACLPSDYLPECEQIAVTLNGSPIKVVRYPHFDEPIALVHATLPEGPHVLSLIIKRKYTKMRLHSTDERFLILENVGKSLKKASTIQVPSQGMALLECDGLDPIFLCFENQTPSPQGQEVLHIEEAGAKAHPTAVQTKAIQEAFNRVSASESLSTLHFSAGIYRSGDLNIPSNVKIHLDSGAVLLASDDPNDLGNPSLAGWARERDPFLHAKDAENITIEGHGHIDGNRRKLDSAGYHKGLAVFLRCQNLRIKGIVVSDSCGWNTTPRHCEDVHIQGVKVLNNRPRWSCINTDGINPDGCRRVRIEDCVMHTGDDAVAVKSTDYGGETQDTEDITVTNLLAFNNSATAKVGTETRAARMENIRFEKILAVHTARLCVIDSFDEAVIKNVSYEDVRATSLHAWPAQGTIVVEIHTPEEGFRPIHGQGRVEEVRLNKVSCEQDGEIKVLGADSERGVSGVHWGEVTVADRRVLWRDVNKNAHAKGVETVAVEVG